MDGVDPSGETLTPIGLQRRWLRQQLNPPKLTLPPGYGPGGVWQGLGPAPNGNVYLPPPPPPLFVPPPTLSQTSVNKTPTLGYQSWELPPPKTYTSTPSPSIGRGFTPEELSELRAKYFANNWRVLIFGPPGFEIPGPPGPGSTTVTTGSLWQGINTAGMLAPGQVPGLNPAYGKTPNFNQGTRGVWSMTPFARGVAIERTLGQNLPSNFPRIDRFHNGVATSIKSMDVTAPTYQNAATIRSTGRGYVDAVANFRGATSGDTVITNNQITSRALDLAVPPGATSAQWEALSDIVSYGTQQNVNVRIVVFP